MNEEMPHDDELRALYRKLPAEEPRREIDDAILAAARANAKARPSRRTSVLRQLRWSLPLAAAAGVLLTIAITRMEDRDAALAPLAAAKKEFRTDELRENDAAIARGRAAATAETEALQAAESPAARAVPAPASPPPELARQAPADPQLRDEIVTGRSKAKTLGYIEGEPPPVQEPDVQPALPPGSAELHAPGAAAGAARRAPETATAAEAEAQSAAPSADSARDSSAAQDLAGADAFEAGRSSGKLWPFGLEVGLASTEACRRATAALGVPCAFRNAVSDMTPATPVEVQEGPLAGQKIVRMKMTIERGKLKTVSFQLAPKKK